MRRHWALVPPRLRQTRPPSKAAVVKQVFQLVAKEILLMKAKGAQLVAKKVLMWVADVDLLVEAKWAQLVAKEGLLELTVAQLKRTLAARTRAQTLPVPDR